MKLAGSPASSISHSSLDILHFPASAVAPVLLKKKKGRFRILFRWGTEGIWEVMGQVGSLCNGKVSQVSPSFQFVRDELAQHQLLISPGAERTGTVLEQGVQMEFGKPLTS